MTDRGDPCSSWRELVSARIDGELTGLEVAALDAHLTGCAACRSASTSMSAATVRARVVAAPTPPDLTARIMAGAPPAKANAVVDRWRVVVGAVGVSRLAVGAIAVPALVAGGHDGLHLVAAHLAIGVGLLAVAHRPHRAAGMVWVVAVLAAVSVVGGVVDVVAGRATWFGELGHLLDVIGAIGARQLSHPPTAGTRRIALP